MDLPDCPPGAEGYQDSVTEVPKKPDLDESSCTKAEYEFQEHLNSLKIRLEDGNSRCMVERRGRDISGKWIYLCYPCAAVCSGESILQTHLSGKKHKIKLSMRNVWPNSIFDDHPFNHTAANKNAATDRAQQRMPEEVDHHRSSSDLDKKYNKYRTVTCHIQDSLDAVKAPLLGVEYLIEHPPEQSHYEPTYMCTLCTKQGHPRTIINHMTCFWHRFNYLVRHFPQACSLLTPYRAQLKYREGVNVIMNRLAQRIEDKYGRKQPVNIDKEEYEKDKVQIHEWVFRSHHFSEKDGVTFVEVVDTGLIESLSKSNDEIKSKTSTKEKREEPSPPVVAAPARPLFNNFSDPDVVQQVDLTASPPVRAEGAVRKKRARPRNRPRYRCYSPHRYEIMLAKNLLLQPNNPFPADFPESVTAINQMDLTASSDSTVPVELNHAATSLAAPSGPRVVAPGPRAVLPGPRAAPPGPRAAPLGPRAAPQGPRVAPQGPRAAPQGPRVVPPGPRAVLPGPGARPPGPRAAPPGPRATTPGLRAAIPTDVETPEPPIYSNSLAYRPAGRQERRAGSVESLSDISDEGEQDRRDPARVKRISRDRHEPLNKGRFEPYDKRRGPSPTRNRHPHSKSQEKQQRPPNYEYKVKLADEKRLTAEDSLKKTLIYHEKNPEKHPLYPEEWKKFWNRRYKEIQAEGKDPSKHDFKPEWIVFWTTRMKELHEEELRIQVNEIYRRMCLSPPDMSKRVSAPRVSVEKSRAPAALRKSPEPRRKSPDVRRRSPDVRRRSPELRRRSPDQRRRSPDRRRPSRYDRPDLREPLPPRPRLSPDRRDRRSPPPHSRRSPPRRRSPERRRSPPPPHHKHTRSRSPLHRRSPARTHISLESIRRSSRSPLSQREPQRNRSPEVSARQLAPSMQTVLISDDELKPDDGLSPWNSDNDIESVCSTGPTDSVVSRSSKRRRTSVGPGPGPGAGLGPAEGPADDVVATLRQLVALEDYLGSLGPKIVDLLADALKMEKEKANSSEELLVRESAVVLIETAKEKLKGAVQAGLVGAGAAHAARAAVVRAAATLHEADKRTRLKQKQSAGANKTAAVPVAVAGVGQVDRAQIAQQMAEALIAQGKTDVSSEDLAVLVDAVVGMAEAKKREAEQTKKVVVVTPPVVPVEKPAPRPAPAKQSGTASALQMLQSAYDENDKKMESSVTPDAMDGLSDSDLETLLKNFNELSAEEQHSLIAYLKKLEAKEPERVERLRQYVSEAASTAPKEPTPEKMETEDDKPEKTVVLESDDDDYTVEEVFKSATLKVKEDQIRQEMEIVKKSLEETKAEPTSVASTKLESSLADITKSLSTSSATDLFALVQASIKSTSSTPAPRARSPSVVVSHTQPRSFGDLPEQSVVQELTKAMQSEPVTTPFNNQEQEQGPRPGPTPFQSLQGLLRPPARFQQQQQQHQQSQQQNQQPQQQHQQSQQQNQQPQQQHQQSQQQNLQPQQQHQQSQQQHKQPQQQHQQQHQHQQPQQHQQQQQHQHRPQQQQNYQAPPQNQQTYQSSQQDQQNYQSSQLQQQNYQSPPLQQQNYQAPLLQQQNYEPPQQNQQQPLYNQGQQQNYQPQQHNQGQQQNYQSQQHNQGPQHKPMLPPHQQRNQQFPPPQHQQQYQTPHHQKPHFNDNRNKPNDNFNQGQWNPRPNMGMGMMGQSTDNFGPYNQGPRNNFMNGRGQDNYDTRPQMNQQFGNNYNNNQNSFRGRGGGGNFGGPNRGRGRGYF